MYVCMYLLSYVSFYVFKNVCMYICMYVYMYVSLVEHNRNVGRAEFYESSGTDFTNRLHQEILTKRRKNIKAQ